VATPHHGLTFLPGAVQVLIRTSCEPDRWASSASHARMAQVQHSLVAFISKGGDVVGTRQWNQIDARRNWTSIHKAFVQSGSKRFRVDGFGYGESSVAATPHRRYTKTFRMLRPVRYSRECIPHQSSSMLRNPVSVVLAQCLDL